jgi:hypothetical protein
MVSLLFSSKLIVHRSCQSDSNRLDPLWSHETLVAVDKLNCRGPQDVVVDPIPDEKIFRASNQENVAKEKTTPQKLVAQLC